MDNTDNTNEAVANSYSTPQPPVQPAPAVNTQTDLTALRQEIQALKEALASQPTPTHAPAPVPTFTGAKAPSIADKVVEEEKQARAMSDTQVEIEKQFGIKSDLKDIAKENGGLFDKTFAELNKVYQDPQKSVKDANNEVKVEFIKLFVKDESFTNLFYDSEKAEIENFLDNKGDLDKAWGVIERARQQQQKEFLKIQSKNNSSSTSGGVHNSLQAKSKSIVNEALANAGASFMIV